MAILSFENVRLFVGQPLALSSVSRSRDKPHFSIYTRATVSPPCKHERIFRALLPGVFTKRADNARLYLHVYPERAGRFSHCQDYRFQLRIRSRTACTRYGYRWSLTGTVKDRSNSGREICRHRMRKLVRTRYEYGANRTWTIHVRGSRSEQGSEESQHAS